jgi:prevent-host-death family protein
MHLTDIEGSGVISALRARANFDRILDRVSAKQESLVIEKRGVPKAVLLSIRDYVKLAAPEPEVLRLLGEESKRKGTHTITSREIDDVIRETRAARKKKRRSK